ncbi:hypothetical protein KKF84_07445 [Myxococcota bacterium]|nr:hypothetical protein [Myxococcota bacterium]MBU1535138.1 hypothetical protein [Myxococcota bacterium]
MKQHPRITYTNRIQKKQVDLARIERKIGLLSWLRLFTLAVGAALVWAGFHGYPDAFSTLFVPLLLFVVLVVIHAIFHTTRERLVQTIDYYQSAVNRVDDKWVGQGNQRTDLVGENHPYALDLDIFGPGSLFELLSTAKTESGERTLARWLSMLPPPGEIIERQEAVQELTPRIKLREKCALIGEKVRTALSPDDLIQWATRAPVFGRWQRLYSLCAVFTGISALGLFFSWLFLDTPLLLMLIPLFLVLVMRAITGRQVSEVIVPLTRASRELIVLGHGLALIENLPVTSQRLAGLKTRLKHEDKSPSEIIAALNRHVAWLESRRNQIFAPVAFFLLWELQFSHRIEKWRLIHGEDIATWLSVMGEFEALLALSNYSFEHPADPFPRLSEEPHCFDAREMGHPLLGAEHFVTNSLTFKSPEQLYVISGSNMSGKSTFLRTIGVNMVMAYAGCTVRCSSMSIASFHLASSLKVSDSLMQGVSKFYAEIRRMKTILNLSSDPDHPVFFLMDEIFQGTNSHDRQLGAQALFRELIRRGALGLITTHDLALTTPPDDLKNQFVNMHFSDSLLEGKLHFDYRIQEGIVRQSNALELMRSVGLHV